MQPQLKQLVVLNNSRNNYKPYLHYYNFRFFKLDFQTKKYPKVIGGQKTKLVFYDKLILTSLVQLGWFFNQP